MPRRLVRRTRSAVVAGVAAGFADYLDVDPVLVRLAFVCLCIFGGSGILLYLISWVLMPAERDVAWASSAGGAPDPPPAGGGAQGDVPGGSSGGPAAGRSRAQEYARKAAAAGEEFARKATETGERIAREAGEAGERLASDVRRRHGSGQGRLVAGVALILIGGLFLIDRFLPWNWWWIGRMWPVALIVVGLAIALGAGREERP